MKKYTQEEKEQIVRQMLEAIGEDPDRIGLKETPARIVRSWAEFYKGYNPDQLPKITTFPNGQDGVIYNQMLCTTGTFNSWCEHHGVMFTGKFYFGVVYNQRGKIFGLSKIARVVDYFASRLQVQERLTNQVIDFLWNKLNDSEHPPLGMGLVLEAEHYCKCARGIKNFGLTRTTELRGSILTRQDAKEEFLDWVNTMVLNH